MEYFVKGRNPPGSIEIIGVLDEIYGSGTCREDEKRLGKERLRQQRWRTRQREKGLKPITGMVSQNAFNMLIEERKKTGETVSDIVEKALLHLRIKSDQCGSEKN